VKHQVIVDGCLFLLLIGTLVTVDGYTISTAEGEDAAFPRHARAVAQAGLGVRLGTPVADVPIATNARPTSNLSANLDTSFLREIEQRVLPGSIVKGPNRHAELPDYYWAENRLLRDRLENAKTTFHRVPTPAYQALTLVAGAAGIGKTFIKGEVFDKDLPETAVSKFNIRELYDDWAKGGVARHEPDLAAADLVISQLKSVIDKTKPRLREFLETQDASFYVIDSLDEIHRDDHAWILEQVADFAFRGDRQFVHVAVFGRGFAFRDFWQDRTEHPDAANVELHVLKPPVFRTTGDLTVSSWNYHTWKFDLTWAPDGKQTSKIPLDAYMRWVESGFSRQDIFQSVTCEANDNMRPDVRRALVQCASERSIVSSALCNLAGNSMIREILQRETLERRPYDERRIAQAYLNAWLIRETEAHDRPSIERPDHLDLYVSLLERVAVKYLEEGAVDSQGYFPVRDGDTVTCEHEGRQQTFRVKHILGGSGLIVTDPRQKGPAKYRFEPFWTHRLLAEMHSERMAKEGRFALGTE